MLKNIYKYLKLYEELGSKAIEVFRYIFTFLALFFVSMKLKDSISIEMLESLRHAFVQNMGDYWMLAILILAGFHHLSDAFIWKSILAERNTIKLVKALQMNWTSLAYSFYSPNRIMDVPSKVLLLDSLDSDFKWKSATLYNFLKPVSTLLLGLVTVSLLYGDFWLAILVLLILVLIFAFLPQLRFLQQFRSYISYWSYSKIIQLIGLNWLRLVTLSLEHVFILLLLGFEFPVLDLFYYLILIHTIITFIPQMAGTEIFAKGYLCMYYLQMEVGQEILLSTAVLVLWIINVLFPVLIGLTNQKNAELKYP